MDQAGKATQEPAGVSRRQFITAATTAAAAVTIVPRHVLGRGFQAPSDLVNVAIAGVGGMGANNLRAVFSQNIVAICDVDSTLVDRRLAQWSQGGGRPQGRRPNQARRRAAGRAAVERMGRSKNSRRRTPASRVRTPTPI